MDLQQLESILNDMQQPAYRFKQIKLAVYKELKDSFGAIENIPLPLRRDLDRLVPFSELTLTTEQQSTDGSVKALFAARDHVSIESVLIPYADGIRTVCVSTEAGCQVNCAFCATGHLGFTRVLTASEIVEQVLYFARALKPRGEKVTTSCSWGRESLFSTMTTSRAPSSC